MNKWFELLKTFSNHSYFVCAMVFLWMYLEYCLALLIENKDVTPYWGMWLIVFVVFFLLKLAVVNHFKVSPLTIRKMMTNALGFKWLSLLFVLTFAMQFAWFVDAAYKLFVDGDNDIKIICQCGLTFFSLLVINLLFPIDDRKQRGVSLEKRQLLVSGFSVSKDAIIARNIDLFLKPIKNYPIKKVIIIRSEALLNLPFADEVKTYNEKLWEQYNTAKDIKERKLLFLKYIKKVIFEETEKDVEVILSDSVSYDDFDVIFEETSKQLRIHEKNTSQTVVFITPGSAIVASALTPLAIKGKRLLLFAEQGKPEMPLKESQVDVLTVEDLLNELWGEYEVNS